MNRFLKLFILTVSLFILAAAPQAVFGLGPLDINGTQMGGNTGTNADFNSLNIINAGNINMSGSITGATTMNIGSISATGNITGAFFWGDGSNLTGITPAQVGAAPAVHTHDGADIVSGLVAEPFIDPLIARDSEVAALLAGYQLKYCNTAVVSCCGGGDYLDPVTAMADVGVPGKWCPAPSAAAPCLLKLKPCVYNIGNNTLGMIPYVDIEGSGENTTIIEGTVDSTITGVVNGASNAELRLLTVNHLGGGNDARAIYNNGVLPMITHVTAKASGAANTNFGIFNENCNPSGQPRPLTMNRVNASASGGNESGGVANFNNSFPRMEDVNAKGTGAANWNYGVYNNNCLTVGSGPSIGMRLVRASASSTLPGSKNYGVLNEMASPMMTHVRAYGNKGSESYGIYNHFSDPTIQDSHATAEDATSINSGVYNDYSSVVITNTHADATGGANSLDSFGVYNNHGSSAIMTDVIAEASDGQNRNYGVFTAGVSTVTMKNVTATATGPGTGTDCGVANDQSITIMTHGQATASGGAFDYGACELSTLQGPGWTVDIRNSVIAGPTATLYDLSGAGLVPVRVGSSQLDGGAAPVTAVCAWVYDETYATFPGPACP